MFEVKSLILLTLTVYSYNYSNIHMNVQLFLSQTLENQNLISGNVIVGKIIFCSKLAIQAHVHVNILCFLSIELGLFYSLSPEGSQFI